MVNLLLIVPRYDANQLHVCHTLMILQVGLQAILVQTIILQLIVVLLCDNCYPALWFVCKPVLAVVKAVS
jgi:hypothetical protein